ncbi:hypothetical protein ebA3327 [Aromatoleum aromaticum EbN1]|uniref:Uncharacterized protein n=1 Tax=Aromatoleum aromaticum (strain DSM 19018 / LMG 30748 / EbN1) TaxID=76114 RepID=Q5P3W3_AROAE|nr:hypothetical protein ebA3327 [Aromatoleum aromaticum EbN1]
MRAGRAHQLFNGLAHEFSSKPSHDMAHAGRPARSEPSVVRPAAENVQGRPSPAAISSA